MKVFRLGKKNVSKDSSKGAVLVVIDPSVEAEQTTDLRDRFPNALIVAESRGGRPKDGFVNVLRVHSSDVEGLEFDSTVYSALLVEGVEPMFYSELLSYRERLADRFDISEDRVRICCSVLSDKGCANFSCYSASSVRDLAAEAGITGISPTIKQEVLLGNSLCLCVKTRK